MANKHRLILKSRFFIETWCSKRPDRWYWQIEDAESVSAYDAKHGTSGGTYMSSVQELELQRLAGITGLEYHHLETPELLSLDLLRPELSQPRKVATSISWIFIALALILFLIPYFYKPEKNSIDGLWLLVNYCLLLPRLLDS